MFWTAENLNLKNYNKLLLIKKKKSILPPFGTLGFATEQRDFVGQRKTECNRLAEEVIR